MVGSSRTSRLISIGLPANIVNDRYVCLQKFFIAIAVVEVSTEIHRAPLVIPSGLLSYTLYFLVNQRNLHRFNSFWTSSRETSMSELRETKELVT